jgi:phosphoribosylglycinamide formyltransferase 1
MRLGVLLSGSGSTYANLVEAINAGSLPASIAVVISSRADAYGLQRAAAYGHPAQVATSADAVTAALRAHGADLVVMCGWLKYWDPPPPFAGRTVNVHPSLLPRHGGHGMYGARVHAAVLAAGDTTSGCTVHLVQGAYDSGAILGQATVPVLAGDTPATLQARVQDAERRLYPATITTFIQQLAAAPGRSPHSA